MPRRNYLSSGVEIDPVSTPPTGRAVDDIYLDDGTNTASGNPGWRYLVSTGPDVWEDVIPDDALIVEEEGSAVDSDVTTINFTGAGATASQTVAGEVEVNIPGGGGGGGGETVAAINVPVVMGASAVEVVIGQTNYDGSTGASHTFKAIVEPDSAVTCEIRLYDRGPVAGPATSAQLASKLTTSTAGLQILSLTLTADAAPTFPDSDEIYNTDRMYEIRAYISGTLGDVFYVGKVSLA